MPLADGLPVPMYVLPAASSQQQASSIAAVPLQEGAKRQGIATDCLIAFALHGNDS
jgi:hypothetical protein